MKVSINMTPQRGDNEIVTTRWCAGWVFENNPTHVLVFYQSELNRQHAIQVCFELFV